jgi:hypothetical protein
MVLDASKHIKGDSQMKNVLLRVVSTSFLAAILMLGVSISDAAASGSLQVVTFVCAPTEAGTITVAGASSSTGAPSVSVGANCSQAVVDMLSAGFKLVSNSSNGTGGVMVLF